MPTLTKDITTLVTLATEKQYSFGADDIAVIAYALGMAGVTRLLDENNRITNDASYALVQYDKANPLNHFDTVFETLVDLEVASWPAHYPQANGEVEAPADTTNTESNDEVNSSNETPVEDNQS